MARTTRATVRWSSSRGSSTPGLIHEACPTERGPQPTFAGNANGRPEQTGRPSDGSEEGRALGALDERAQPLAPRRMAELSQRLGLDLPDALAGHLEVLTHLLERVVRLLPDAEPHPEDLLLARRQRGQHLPGLLGQVHVDDRIRGRDQALVLDEVAEVGVLLLTDGRLEADGLLRDLEDLADLVQRELHLLRDLLRRGLAADLLHQVAAGADQLVDRLDHVHRDADGARLIGDGPGDGLADPPRRVRAELVPTLVLELVDGLHEAEVRLHQLGLRPLRLALADPDRLVVPAQQLHREVGLFLDALDLPHRGADVP